MVDEAFFVNLKRMEARYDEETAYILYALLCFHLFLRRDININFLMSSHLVYISDIMPRLNITKKKIIGIHGNLQLI